MARQRKYLLDEDRASCGGKKKSLMFGFTLCVYSTRSTITQLIYYINLASTVNDQVYSQCQAALKPALLMRFLPQMRFTGQIKSCECNQMLSHTISCASPAPQRESCRSNKPLMQRRWGARRETGKTCFLPVQFRQNC